jgi:putative ABC transport system ATP-binding protein
MNPDSIHLESLAKRYPGASQRAALEGVDLSITPGTFLAIVGKSGSGKSTLFNLIAGLDRPSAGSVRIGADEISAMDEASLAHWRGRSIGLVFQFFQLLPTLSAEENVLAAIEFVKGRISAEDRDRVGLLLDKVGLSEHKAKRPAQLSGGQQQRVAIARALANDPPIILADEPTGNLDSATARSVIDFLASLADEGRTVIVITHDVEIAARAMRQVTVADGRIAADSHNSARAA